MNRKDFTKSLIALGACPFMISEVFGEKKPGILPDDEKYTQLRGQKEFIENWLSDLLDSMDKTIDRETQVKIVEGCGRGCFNRHQFKKDIALKGSGSIDKLIEAYSQNFEIWKEENLIHLRYGKKSSGCYCPAAVYRSPKPNDLHCECTRTTHQTIFETALGKPFKVEILESVRRGGVTCHFVVHLD